MKRDLAKIALVSSLAFGAMQVVAQPKVSVRTNFFRGNLGTSVQSPTLELAQALFGLTFSVHYSLDRVSIPPVRGLSATPTPVDAVTGASRPVSGDDPANEAFIKKRNQVTVGVSAGGLGFGYYYSHESDYVGRMATVRAAFDFNQGNTNLATSYSYGWDRIAPLGTDTSYAKTQHSFNLTLTQTLDRVTIARVGVDVARVSGFQSNPYRAVFVAGEHRLEVHPLQRRRAALFVKVNRYFRMQASLNAGYRFYRDDWQVQSHTFDFFYHQYFSDDVLIRYRYRYYVQSGAHFFRRSYPTPQPFLTSDYKLEPFNSHLFGVKLEYRLRALAEQGWLSLLSNATFDAKYERYFSSNDFTADIFQFGLVFNY